VCVALAPRNFAAEGMVVATVVLTDALTVGPTVVPTVAGSVQERGSSFLRVQQPNGAGELESYFLAPRLIGSLLAYQHWHLLAAVIELSAKTQPLLPAQPSYHEVLPQLLQPGQLSVANCVGVCWRVMACVGVCWSVLQCVAVRSGVCCSRPLVRIGVCYSVLACVAVWWGVVYFDAESRSVLQCVAVLSGYMAPLMSEYMDTLGG